MNVDPHGTAAPGVAAAPTIDELHAAAVDALRAVEEGQRDSLDRLRATLCSYLAALRAAGLPKQEALERVRAVIVSPSVGHPGWLLPAAREALMDLATHWCTEQYTN